MKKGAIKLMILIGVVVVSIFPGGVFAEQVKTSMTVSPPNRKILLVPGESYRGSISVSSSNDSTAPTHYSISVGPFSEVGQEGGRGDYGIVDYVSKSSYNQIVDWITLDETSGIVEPNSTNEIGYTINVPKGAPAGGQYATIIVQNDNDYGKNDGGVAIQNIFEILSIIYAEVSGETRMQGAIVENNVPAFSFSSPLTVSSMIRNDGNVHTDAKYTLQVWPLFSGTEVYSNEEKPMTNLILPESERYNMQEWKEAPAIGVFRVKQTVELFGDVSTVEKIVIICPLWLLLLILGMIALVVFWLVARSRNRRRG